MRKLIDLEADVFGFLPGDISSYYSQEPHFRKYNLECVDLCHCFKRTTFSLFFDALSFVTKVQLVRPTS